LLVIDNVADLDDQTIQNATADRSDSRLPDRTNLTPRGELL
jgi:hypothetical protein